MTKEIKSYSKFETKNLDKSQIEIKITVPFSALEKYRGKALKSINESITLDGFRKGMIPENILISKVGEMTILEEMAELAISRAYVDVLIDNKIDAIDRPKVQITKLAKDNDMEFVAITAIVPTITLPDYESIAKKINKERNPDEEKVTDKDIEDAIMKIRRSKVSHEGHDHSKMTDEEHEKSITDNLPEVNDDFVKSLGDFNDVPDFKNKLSSILAEEKKNTADEKRRIKIADAISDKTQVQMPDVMIESELGRIQAQFESDIERMGVKLDDYLKHAKKTIEDIRKEWRPHAEKKAKLQLILNEIAKAQNIKPDQAEITAEVNHILEHYKDADQERASVYAETVLTNEKVFDYLQNLS